MLLLVCDKCCSRFAYVNGECFFIDVDVVVVAFDVAVVVDVVASIIASNVAAAVFFVAVSTSSWSDYCCCFTALIHSPYRLDTVTNRSNCTDAVDVAMAAVVAAAVDVAALLLVATLLHHHHHHRHHQ